MHIAVYLLACAIVGAIGHRHRWLGFWGVFAVSVLLTPLVGAIVIILSWAGYHPPRHEREQTTDSV